MRGVARREFLIAFGALASAPRFLAWLSLAPCIAVAQTKVRRVGFFYGGSRESARRTGRYAAFIRGMNELGYVENKDFVLVERYIEGGFERIVSMAKELLDAKVEVIVVSGGTSRRALQQLTKTVPVVVVVAVDPVREGFAESLARPGKNFTGLSAVLSDIFPKHVELIKATLPGMSRLAVLAHPSNQTHPALMKGVEAAARANGIRVLQVNVNASRDFEPGFAEIRRERAEALLMLGDAFFVQHFPQIAELAAKHRLVSTYSGREYPEAGGFMSYGPNFREHYRRAAGYVDKILKGAKAGDLPMEQPTKFELVINRRTAKALGVAIPDELLLRADEVIE
jgi:ABC-type uncharacterized transport system substrate-binding protein